MRTDLWNFALEAYARPGVEDLCLRLQANGNSVCLLLCGAWLGQRGVAWNAQAAQQLKALVKPWDDDVVNPLRQLRTQWRSAALEDVELSKLRDQVKALELEAEHQLLLRLENVAQEWPQVAANDLPAWLEGLAAQADNSNHDTLHALRVAITNT